MALKFAQLTSNEKIIKVEKNDIVISTIPVTSLLKMIGHTSSLKFRGVIFFILTALKNRYYQMELVGSILTQKKLILLESQNQKKWVLTSPLKINR